MPTVAVSSPNGGVGKTTLIANLAVELASPDRRVTLVEFSDQNILRRYFGLDTTIARTIVPGETNVAESAAAIAAGAYWVDDNVRLIPYGALAAEGEYVSPHLGLSFAEALSATEPFRDDLVLVDMPATALSALKAHANIDLIMYVLRADLSSAAVMMDHDLAADQEGRSLANIRYLINQIDRRRPLCVDVEDTLKVALGDQLLSCVGYDEAAPESFARGVISAKASPHSAMLSELKTLAGKIDALLIDASKGEKVFTPTIVAAQSA